MPEPEPPRVAGPVDEVEADQLVHGSQRRRLGHAACRGRELGVERIPDHGRAVERESRVVAQERELLGQIRRDRRGNVEPRTPERPGELLEVEGVAAALLVQRLHGRLVDLIIQELASLRLRERTDLDPLQHAGAVRALECGGESAGRLPRPEGGCDEDGSVGRAPEEGAEELDGRRVGPVEVVDEEHERRRGREPLEQVAHRGVHAVAVVEDRGGTASRRRVQRRQDLRERVAGPVVECIEAVRLEPPDVFVERVDEDPEGEIALELGCRPAEDEVPMRIGPSGGLGEQASLPDARFADQCERGRRWSVSQAEERLVEDAARLGASNEVLARADHVGSAQHRSGCVPRTVRGTARCRRDAWRRGS